MANKKLILKKDTVKKLEVKTSINTGLPGTNATCAPQLSGSGGYTGASGHAPTKYH